MNDIEQKQHMERRTLKPGDRVEIIGRHGRIDVQMVEQCIAAKNEKLLKLQREERWRGQSNRG